MLSEEMAISGKVAEFVHFIFNSYIKKFGQMLFCQPFFLSMSINIIIELTNAIEQKTYRWISWSLFTGECW